mgnify:CR=1 FL=1
MLALRRRTQAVRKAQNKPAVSPEPVKYWDPHLAKRVAKLSPGQNYLSTTDELLVSVVGSTVVVSLRDPEAGLVAMSNLVAATHGLPALEKTARTSAHRYVEQVLSELTKKLEKRGASHATLEVTLVGGMSSNKEGTDPVTETLDVCRRFFAERQIKITTEFVGSKQAKKVYTSLREPCPHVWVLDEVSNTVSQREQRYTQQVQLEHLLGSRKTTMKFT